MKGVHNLMHPLLVDNTLCCMESLNGRQISPLYAALGHHAVCKWSVVGTERIGFILDAYNNHVVRARVAQRTHSCWSNTHYAALSHCESLAVYLKLALAAHDDIQFLVCLVCMKDSAALARSKGL